MFELLSGRRPHELTDRSLPDAARIIREEEATRLGSLATRWRGDVETIVGKALDKDPARRYLGADELAADVRRHLSDQPITAHAPSRFYQLRKFAQRHWELDLVMTASPRSYWQYRMAAAFSADESFLAALVADDRVAVFEAETGARRYSLELSGSLSPNCLAATDSGFLTVTRDGHVAHWAAATGELLAEDHIPGPIHSMAWDEPHGRLALVSDGFRSGEHRLFVGPIGAIEELGLEAFAHTGVAGHYPMGWVVGGSTLVGSNGAQPCE